MVEMMEVQMETVVQPGDEKMEEQSRWLIKKSGEWRVFFFRLFIEFYTRKRGTLS